MNYQHLSQNNSPRRVLIQGPVHTSLELFHSRPDHQFRLVITMNRASTLSLGCVSWAETCGTSNEQWGGQPRGARWASQSSPTEGPGHGVDEMEGRLPTKLDVFFPRLEDPDFVGGLLVGIIPAMVGSMKKIEAPHHGIGADIVLFNGICRANRVGMTEGQGGVVHHWYQRSPHAGFSMSALHKGGGGQNCVLYDADAPGVAVAVASHFVVAEMLLHPKPSALRGAV